MNPFSFSILTELRFFAAIIVVLHHMPNSWPHISVVKTLAKYGWLSVDFFFILSGFVLMWSFRPHKAIGDFIRRRVVRIFPLHIICLAISLIAYVIIGNPLAGYVGSQSSTLLNIFLLHDWIVGQPEIRQAWNGVSWALSCEFFFYLSAPLLFMCLISKCSQRSLILLMGLLWLILFCITVIHLTSVPVPTLR